MDHVILSPIEGTGAFLRNFDFHRSIHSLEKISDSQDLHDEWKKQPHRDRRNYNKQLSDLVKLEWMNLFHFNLDE